MRPLCAWYPFSSLSSCSFLWVCNERLRIMGGNLSPPWACAPIEVSGCAVVLVAPLNDVRGKERGTPGSRVCLTPVNGMLEKLEDKGAEGRQDEAGSGKSMEWLLPARIHSIAWTKSPLQPFRTSSNTFSLCEGNILLRTSTGWGGFRLLKADSPRLFWRSFTV